jgi:hypothetical protein
METGLTGVSMVGRVNPICALITTVAGCVLQVPDPVSSLGPADSSRTVIGWYCLCGCADGGERVG